MKIHRIETLNLNSLYGTQKVDLDETLAGDSLFLIYGPTGSGKSTLMDAVSLALFGATPRLDAERGNASADPRAIMSRGTWLCSATVVFSKLENGARQAYRATWTCERAWKKPDGQKKTPARSLERLRPDGPADILVSSEKKKVFTPVFEKVLEGFGVKDFNRSMLLAQGQFDAFLGAPPDQRAEILERLTDTSIYQDLGKRAARIRGRHTGRLTALRTLAAAGGGLEADALQVLEQTHGQLTGEHQRLERLHESASGRLLWFDGEVERRHKLAEAQVEEAELKAEAVEAAPELARLTAHERCQGEKAFQLFDQHGSAQKQVADLQGKIDALDQSLPGLQGTARDKERQAVAAAASAGSAVSHLEALRPLAETSDKTDTAASAAVVLAQETSAKRGTADTLAKEREEALDEATEAVAAVKDEAATARAALETNAADGELAAAWGPLRTRLDKVVARSERLGSDAGALKEREGALTRDRLTLTQDQTSYEQSHETELEPARQAQKNAALALTELQSQDGFEASREQAAGAVERARAGRDALQVARPTVAAARTDAAKLAEGQELIKSLAGGLDQAQEALVALAQDLGRRDELESQAGAALDRTKRVAALVEHRVALEDGESCPLCGSDEHPWANDPDRAAKDAEISETVAAAERVRDEARAAHQVAERVHRAAEGGARALSAKLDLLRGQQDEAAAQQVGLDQRATSDLAATHLGPDSAVEAVDEAIGAATGQWDEARAALDALDTARRGVDDADKLLRAALEASKDTETALRDRATALRERGQQLEATGAEHAEALSKQGVEQAACSAMLREHGLELIGDDPTGWRDLGDARCRKHETRKKAVADLEARVTTLETARVGKKELLSEQLRRRDELVALQGRQQADRDEKRTEAARARGALDEEWKAVVRVDPERDPDTLPVPDSNPSVLIAAQSAWVKHTEDAAKKMAAEQATALASLEDARTRRQTLDEQQTELETARVEARGALDAALHALDLTADDALTTARLDDRLLAEIRTTRKQLDKRSVAVQTRMAERLEQLEAHTITRPEALAEEPERDDLAAAVAASKELVDEAAKACQDTGDRLRDHHRALEAQKANRDTLREAEKAAQVWQTLHQYIGVNDGGKFKEFAQALNLGQLLDKANVHMARLHKRYRLIPRLEEGLPTLEFDLSDLWQVGERVAPRSLSGGERFLVSLSLALGLSDFRTVKMPIETLLLDEGFGTLDQKSLTVALAALSQLRADGRQVGIISHVVGLREKIPARIEVRPLGGGRSETISTD